MSTEADNGSDNFDAEFEAAREAEYEPDAVDASVEGEAEQEGEGEDEAPAPKPEKSEAEKAAASLQKALRAERRERQALQAKIEQLERIATAPPKAEANPWEGIPDPNEDPIGALEHIKRLADTQAEQQRQESARAQQEAAMLRQVQSIADAMRNAEEDFRDDTPDYDNAVNFLRDQVLAELEDNGMSKAEALEKMNRDFLNLVPTALRAGKNPAEVAYKMAQKRGYKGLDKAGAKIETIRQGQKAAVSLSSGGQQTSKPLTAATVANLKGKAFDAAFDKLRAQERRR
jgi:hypothetical protein